MAMSNLLGMSPRQRHHSLDSFDMGLVLLALLLLSLAGFAFCSLCGSTCFQLSRDELQIVRHLNPAFEEEKLQITSFVLELYLVSILERLADCAAWAKHGKYLTPMGALDSIKSRHKGILFFGGPRPPLTR